MQIKLIAVGKTDDAALQDSVNTYVKRLSHYCNFSLEIIPDLKKTKNMDESLQKSKEGALILKHVNPSDILVLLDEREKVLLRKSFQKKFRKSSTRE